MFNAKPGDEKCILLACHRFPHPHALACSMDWKDPPKVKSSKMITGIEISTQSKSLHKTKKKMQEFVISKPKSGSTYIFFGFSLQVGEQNENVEKDFQRTYLL